MTTPELRISPDGRVAARTHRIGAPRWAVVAGPDASWLTQVRPSDAEVETWTPLVPAVSSPEGDSGLLDEIVSEYSHACPHCPQATPEWVVGVEQVREIVHRHHGETVARGAVLRSERDAARVESPRIPDDAVVRRAARELFNWNTADPTRPRFVIHHLEPGDDDTDPYDALVRKVLELSAPAVDTAPPADEQTNPSQAESPGQAPQRFPTVSEQTNSLAVAQAPAEPTRPWLAAPAGHRLPLASLTCECGEPFANVHPVAAQHQRHLAALPAREDAAHPTGHPALAGYDAQIRWADGPDPDDDYGDDLGGWHVPPAAPRAHAHEAVDRG